jgi:AraC-like DNA-binding protein
VIVEHPRVRFLRHQGDAGGWELASARPDPRLVAYVRDYTGYVEHATRPMRRLEAAFPGVPLIISFGPTIRLTGVHAPPALHRSFVAGLDDGYTLTEYTGEQRGVQINFTPIGARLFFGRPMVALARRVVALDNVLGPLAERLAQRLYEAPDWAARFDLLDALILGRIATVRAPAAGVVHAWQRLQNAGGALGIGRLAAEIGCSRKHLVTTFRGEIGLPPKTLARILRFDRVVKRLERAGRPHWAEIALDCGYYDQAHLIRDFRQFTGTTPTGWLRRRLPDGGGVAG